MKSSWTSLINILVIYQLLLLTYNNLDENDIESKAKVKYTLKAGDEQKSFLALATDIISKFGAGNGSNYDN